MLVFYIKDFSPLDIFTVLLATLNINVILSHSILLSAGPLSFSVFTHSENQEKLQSRGFKRFRI